MSNRPFRFPRIKFIYLASGLMFPSFQEAGSGTTTWWLWVLLILVVLIVLIWWFWSNRKTSQASSQSTSRSMPAAPEYQSKTSRDDLAMIEGIGPKITSLLHDAGITTFAELAGTDKDRLDQILNDGGIRLADPGTWAEQAKLAAAGDIQGLRTLQEKLKGGRRV